MRPLKTLKERRAAALDVARFLATDVEFAMRYPSGSNFTAVGISDNGDAVVHVEGPDRSDAFERIPATSLRYLSAYPEGVLSETEGLADSNVARIMISRQNGKFSRSVIAGNGEKTRIRWKMVKKNVTVIRLGEAFPSGPPASKPVNDRS